MVDRKPIQIFTENYSFPVVEDEIDETRSWDRPRLMQFTQNGLFSKIVRKKENIDILQHEWEILLHFKNVGLSSAKIVPEPLLFKRFDKQNPNTFISQFSESASLLNTRLEGKSMEEIKKSIEKKNFFPFFNEIVRGGRYSIEQIHKNGVLLPDLHFGNILLSTNLVTSQMARVSFVDFEHAITQKEFENNLELRNFFLALFKQEGDLPDSSQGTWNEVLKAIENRFIRDIVEFFITSDSYNYWNKSQYHPTLFCYEKPENINWQNYNPLNIRGYSEWERKRKEDIALRDKSKAEKIGFWPKYGEGKGPMEKIDKKLSSSKKLKIAEQMGLFSDQTWKLANLEIFPRGSDGGYGNREIEEYMEKRWQRIIGIPVLNVLAPYLIEEICGTKLDKDVKKYIQLALDPQNCISLKLE